MPIAINLAIPHFDPNVVTLVGTIRLNMAEIMLNIFLGSVTNGRFMFIVESQASVVH